jgi:hypothetical protein
MSLLTPAGFLDSRATTALAIPCPLQQHGSYPAGAEAAAAVFRDGLPGARVHPDRNE